MEIKLIVLEKVVKWITGGALLDFVKRSVALVNNDDISGEEKRALVIKNAKEMFTGVGTLLISLAIEVAVILLRAEIEKEA